MNFSKTKKFLKNCQRFLREKAGFWSRLPRSTRIAVGVFAPIVIVAVLIPINQTDAGIGSIIDDLAYSLVSKVMWAIAWFLAMIGGIVVAVVAWFVEVALNMSTQVVNSTPVQSGFPITLAITNMGFVAAVIVIAFATILRYKDYVVKKTLPKLIAAALLVNFSLVFAGAIINFADQFTLYFIKQINPASEGSITNFASAMAGAFNPQKNFLQGTDPSAGEDKAIEGVASPLGSEIGKYLIPVTSTSFTLFAIIAIILTLVAFVVLLLVRYVYLVVLLIVMPFVWLMWIFPGTKKYFSDWWSKFLKQVFFAPISVFFLYLAILFATKMSVEGSPTGTATASNTFNSLSQFGTEFLTTPVQNFMNSLVIVGLMLGGMFAASKIGAVWAKEAEKAVTGAVKGGAKAMGKVVVVKTSGGVTRAMHSTFAVPPPAGPPPMPASITGPGFVNAVKRGFWKTKNAVAYNRASTAVRSAAYNAGSPLRNTQTGLSALNAMNQYATYAGKKKIFTETWKGMKKGSGLFKKEELKDWECQATLPNGNTCGEVKRSKKKPTTPCANGHVNWKEA